jgi:beta-glucosidase-like glycosyl hydrolase
MRDPRWGRNSEVPSEDPRLAGRSSILHNIVDTSSTFSSPYLYINIYTCVGEYAAQMVRGMQEGPDPKYLKMIAGLKHYLAYSVEDGRESFIPNVTTFDLWDTYLMQYKIGFAAGDVDGVQGEMPRP